MAETNGNIFPVENLAQFQINTMKKYGDSIALVDANTGQQYTYAAVIDRVQRLAAGLRKIGVRQGDILCALTFNTIEYPIIWYAVNLLGATFQTASPLYTDDELDRRFKECSTKVLVTVPELVHRILSIKDRLNLQTVSNEILRTVIVIGETELFVPYHTLFSKERVTKCADNDPRTTAAILLSSSGTTGLPKCVQLSHVNIIANMVQVRQNTGMTSGICTVVALPLFHHFGVHASLSTGLYIGLKLVVMDKFDVQNYLSLVQLHRAEFLQMVPTMAARLVKFPDRSLYDLSSVRFIQTGAAPLGIWIEKHLREMFRLKLIGQGYGSTEAGYTAGNMVNTHKAGSCGVAPIGVIIKIVDIETGEILPPNKLGEIHVSGPQVSFGYLNHPEANAVSFGRDGCFKTGDIGYIDDDGFLFIVDRLKELIKFRGLQVAPAYLEDILVKHPAVVDAAVVGVPHPEDGELPKAFVVKQQDKDITEKEIIDYMDDHVSSFERLRGGVEFIHQIPRNPSGKILRRFFRDGGNKSKL